eukprot:15435914-Alexandrium_andersonii.AAC.1
MRCIAIDLLHSYYLGSLLAWAKAASWALLSSKVWGRLAPNAETAHLLAVEHYKAELFTFYTEHAREHPEEPLTRLPTVKPKRFGTASAPRLKAKAAQTWGVALFLVGAVRRHLNHLGANGPILLEA